MHPILEAMQQDAELAEAVDVAFDFHLADPELPDWFSVSSPEQFAILGQDATGSVFLTGCSSGRVLFVTSEGQAGVVARSTEEFFRLMVTHPFWMDILKFSGNGTLAEMRRAVPLLAREFESDASLIASQSLAAKRLSLFPNNAAIDLLHDAVATSGGDVVVRGIDGTEFESLFNRFTVESNPFWRVA